MSVLPDHWIRENSITQGMITPFVETQKQKGVVSYGLSSYGYDLRVSDTFKLFTNIHSAVVDPKNFSSTTTCVDYKGPICTMPPHSFMLAHSLEYFKIPRDVLVLCLGKSTYARCGINVHITPLEPEWEGHITLEFSNTTSLPVKIYAHEGAGQLVFLKSDNPCEISYKERQGKYMYQTGITSPWVQK